MKSMKGTAEEKIVATHEGNFPVAGIGASASGLQAFKQLLKSIPEKSGIAYILMQHNSAGHNSKLSELLQKFTALPITEINEPVSIKPNQVYIIPGNKVPKIQEAVIQLQPITQMGENDQALPIDIFFTEVANGFHENAFGIILSGTATDGTVGLKAIKENGGITFAQEEDKASYTNMPASAIQAGVVDFILSAEEIPKKLLEITKALDGSDNEKQDDARLQDDQFKQILSLLRIRKGTDFTYYKQTTIRRRILRRMALNKKENLTAYLTQLRENKKEQDILYQDILIPVTSFFRDPKSFENIWDKILPTILHNKTEGQAVRIWIAGCSTGEEVYSFAIFLKELVDDRPEKIQILGTDISEQAIAKARTGIYSKPAMAGLSAGRIQEFFTKTNEGYQVNKYIRDICIFAVHNFLKDPPFGKMDFISCRNVLIYMQPYLQKKALTTFHYSLNPGAFLLLGKSETTSSVPDLFTSAGSNEKLFIRKDTRSKFYQSVPRYQQNLDDNNTPKNTQSRSDFEKTADEIMLSKYTPAGVVINEAMDIVHFRGSTGNYLQPSPGKASLNLLKMAKDGLAFELRSILHKVKKVNEAVIKENISIKVEGNLQLISIEVLPLPNLIEPHYLVLFHDNTTGPFTAPVTRHKKNAPVIKEEQETRIHQLEMELAQVREDMRSITEEQEASNEELQSANEELLSSSEELQSLNEELETSKEELQSINEELTVVNQELLSMNEQVTTARDYSEAIVSTTREPLLVLDVNMKVRSANNSFYKTFRLTKAETEDILIYNIANKEWDIPELRTLLEMELPRNAAVADYKIKHTFKSVGKKILLMNACQLSINPESEKISLLFIEDVTDKITEEEKRNRTLINSLPVAIYTCDEKGAVQFYNKAAVSLWGREPVKGKELWCGSWKIYNADGSPLSLDNCPMALTLKEKRPVTGKEIIIERPNGEKVNVLPYPQPVFDTDGKLTGAINTLIDLTAIKKSQQMIKENEERFRFIADSLPQKIWTADADGNITYVNHRWYDYTGLKFDDIKNWEWKKFVHPDDWDGNEKRWLDSIKTGRNFEYEHRFLNKEGDYKWHLSRGLPFRDEEGNIKMWIGSNTEIQKVKEEEQRKSDFIKMVSHELKTPVTSIKGYVQLLLMMLKDETEGLPMQLKPSLFRINNLVLRLTRLITEMLDLSRIETGKLELNIEPINISKLVLETVEDFGQINSNHPIKVFNNYTCTIFGDKSRIEQVLTNFLENAAKYSLDNDKIEVYINKAGNEQVAVSIKDYGIGIDKKDQEKIFERFYRVEGKSEQTYPGFGIGLFIAKSIIERNNGTITLVSEKGKGSEFTFTLPIAFENKN